ncbi:PP2C family protein-serine/threonine phosphatase [Streptomyces sp. NPDC045369]|uniref:PP2C family protein-serine/threonine phosphatase n=1 Tax=Streptomyces sp. NPDC045369 TaxID=3155732 RepID=UPI0033D8896A
MRRHTFHALPPLRHAVRRLGAANALPVETRARLVLSVSALADSVIQAGYGVTLESSRTCATDRSSSGGPSDADSRGPGGAPGSAAGGAVGPQDAEGPGDGSRCGASRGRASGDGGSREGRGAGTGNKAGAEAGGGTGAGPAARVPRARSGDEGATSAAARDVSGVSGASDTSGVAEGAAVPPAANAPAGPSAAAASGFLAVTLRTPAPVLAPPADATLLLPAEVSPDAATWHVPLPAGTPEVRIPSGRGPDDATTGGSGRRRDSGPAPLPTGASDGNGDGTATDPATENRLLEEELRVALARVDSLAADQRRLTHELAETNSGVLALYVQLEERDEQLRTAHGHILRELEDALRPPPIAVDGLEVAVHYAPAGTDAPTGGDFYDWFTLPDGTVHITVVDALGHGVRSTRSALNVTHAVRTLALEGHPLKSIVARTDEILAPFDPELMATVLLARIDPAGGDLLLANGSHPPALVVRATGGEEYLEVRGRGVGYPFPGSERLLHAKLDEGDLLVLYTDGLTESRRDPREGEQRLAESARRHRDRPVQEIPGAIAEDMHTVILHSDDTLALAVRLSPRSR